VTRISHLSLLCTGKGLQQTALASQTKTKLGVLVFLPSPLAEKKTKHKKQAVVLARRK
jgi:hypothetical protein